jgi:pimeloyl-ACP methyl ester carboxylesterase
MTPRHVAYWIASALLFLPHAVSAQATRADLAAAYLRMDAFYDRAEREGRIADSTRAQVNRTFDRATRSFFGGQLVTTLAIMDTAVLQLAQATALTPPPRERRDIGAAPRQLNGRPIAATREALLARLARVDSTGPMQHAWLSARERVRLLADVPNAERSAEFLVEPGALAKQVAGEVQALERGRDPYARRTGDVWRAIRGEGGAPVVMRVVASKRVAESKRPVGLLIALHGFGGDENMFVDAYGQGEIVKQAARHDLLLVSPSTTPFVSSAVAFDSVVAVMQRAYLLDSTRIYVVGHSMGAGAAANLVRQRPARIAAAACLAGGSAIPSPEAPRTLFIGAEFDGIVPVRGVEAAARATPRALYEMLPNEGHSLMVGPAVRRAIPWLVGASR